MRVAILQPRRKGLLRPLDLVPGAYLAISCARRLKGDYTGPLIRIRSTADNSETDIGQRPDGTLDEDAIVAHAVESAVTTFYDQSGNGRDLTQAVAGAQPLIYSSGFFRTPDLAIARPEFGGHYLGYYDIGKAQPMTVFSVFQPDLANTIAGDVVFDGGDPAGFNLMELHRNAGNTGYDMDATPGPGGATPATAFPVGTTGLVTTVWNGASSTYRFNDSAEESGLSPGTQAPEGFTIGSEADGFSGMFGGFVEALLYDSVLSGANQTKLRNNIKAYYTGIF